MNDLARRSSGRAQHRAAPAPAQHQHQRSTSTSTSAAPAPAQHQHQHQHQRSTAPAPAQHSSAPATAALPATTAAGAADEAGRTGQPPSPRVTLSVHRDGQTPSGTGTPRRGYLPRRTSRTGTSRTGTSEPGALPGPPHWLRATKATHPPSDEGEVVPRCHAVAATRSISFLTNDATDDPAVAFYTHAIFSKPSPEWGGDHPQREGDSPVYPPVGRKKKNDSGVVRGVGCQK